MTLRRNAQDLAVLGLLANCASSPISYALGAIIPSLVRCSGSNGGSRLADAVQLGGHLPTRPSPLGTGLIWRCALIDHVLGAGPSLSYSVVTGRFALAFDGEVQ